MIHEVTQYSSGTLDLLGSLKSQETAFNFFFVCRLHSQIRAATAS